MAPGVSGAALTEQAVFIPVHHHKMLEGVSQKDYLSPLQGFKELLFFKGGFIITVLTLNSLSANFLCPRKRGHYTAQPLEPQNTAKGICL